MADTQTTTTTRREILSGIAVATATSAAVGLIAALGMSSSWDEPKSDKWAWMRLIHQTWAPEWQRIAKSARHGTAARDQ